MLPEGSVERSILSIYAKSSLYPIYNLFCESIAIEMGAPIQGDKLVVVLFGRILRTYILLSVT